MAAVVQSVENLTALSGRLVARAPHERLPGWDRAVLEVSAAAAVPGKADLLSSRAGQRLEIAVPHDLLVGVAPGSALRLRAKLAQGEAMAEPHPDPDDFTVEPP